MPEQPIMSAAVMRRLAEAADGYRTGQPVWFLMREEDLADVYPATTTEELESLQVEHPDYTVFGPFRTEPDPVPAPAITVIRIDYEDGSYLEMDGAGIDAFFLSRAAREKFVYPYYARVLGPEAAAEMKQEDEEMESHRHGGGVVAMGGIHVSPTKWAHPRLVDLHFPVG